MKISSTDAHRSHYKLTNVNFGAIVTNAFADGGQLSRKVVAAGLETPVERSFDPANKSPD